MQAGDASARTLTLQWADNTAATYKVGAQAENFGSVQANDKVKVTVAEELDIYLLANGRLPEGATAGSLGVNAKLTFNDPNADASYRLLTLVYPNGRKETLKVGLDAKISEMADGDSVVVRPVEVTKIKVESTASQIEFKTHSPNLESRKEQHPMKKPILKLTALLSLSARVTGNFPSSILSPRIWQKPAPGWRRNLETQT